MKYLTPLISCLLVLLAPAYAQTDPFEQAMALLENQQMRLLAEQQSKPGVVIDPFHSDGCSGGMTKAWKELARSSPGFAGVAGNNPPWEFCCVEHDSKYWRGASENGYEKRKQADRELRACVIQSAIDQGDEWAKNLGLSKQEVIEITNITADLMYQAVRLGGAPCTGLPWRWGHGWPECRLLLELN